MAAKQVFNYGAGPAKMPPSVLEKARDQMMSYNGCGMSVMELSHRGPEFGGIITKAEATLRSLLKVPDNYKVLFVQGGGTTQFSSVPLNLMKGDAPTADYIVTGTWSKKAAAEASKYGVVNHVFPPLESFTSIPSAADWKLNPDAAYVYYCANETVNGVEFPDIPDTGSVPLVADMSSNILSRPFDVSKFGVIYAGAQKNIGCSGVTIVIVREDLLGSALPFCPQMLDYAVQAKGGSMLNTPPTWAIYMASLVFDWIVDEGGLDEFEKRSDAKASRLYGIIDGSDGFFTAPVASAARSRMNVPFRLKGGDEDLEAKFLSEASAAGLLQLKGHRSVGGLRASIYNATSVEDTEALATFMEAFMAAN